MEIKQVFASFVVFAHGHGTAAESTNGGDYSRGWQYDGILNDIAGRSAVVATSTATNINAS